MEDINMCGICGLIKKTRNVISDDLNKVKNMNNALIHRGPDSGSIYSDEQVIFAMRRLKIIDLEGGDQPIFNEDKSIAIVANGEIYNFVELRAKLENKGHVFHTKSDVESIIHSYEEFGSTFLSELRGMFSFCLYDIKKRKVIIARDRMGEKPLYYHFTDEEIIFSSEMKSLIKAIDQTKMVLNNDAINLYFYNQYIPEPLTLFENVKKLPAAHYLELDLIDFKLNLKQYWNYLEFDAVESDYIEMIHSEFENTCKIMQRADVPVGIALSGGIDSSAIAVAAAKYYPNKMHAFSVGYPNRPKNDEREKAKNLAIKLKMEFHEVELKTNDFVESFQELVYWMDDPIADIAAFGYYSLMKLAKENEIPVILNGIGGDELFWGYNWVCKAVELSEQKQEYFNADISFKTSIKNVFKPRIIKQEPETSLVFYDIHKDYIYADKMIHQLYTDDFKNTIDKNKWKESFTSNEWADIPLQLMDCLNKTWLLSNCIALTDRMSMASSIELRLPFVDYKLIELVNGLRKGNNIKDFKQTPKKIFIDAMKNEIPSEIIERRKQGFTPPVKEWYKAIIKNYGHLCDNGFLVQNNILKPFNMKKPMKGAIKNKGIIISNADLFLKYKIILLEVYLRTYIGGENNLPINT
jgi:asparagine synthase (glutamine-hydrolysing)